MYVMKTGHSCSHAAQVDAEMLGRKQLAGVGRRALVRAAAALGTRIKVEHILPTEVLDALDAQRLLALQLAVDVRDRGQPAARRKVAAEDVGDNRDDVKVLAIRQQVQEQQHERRVRPEADLP